ncbi:CD225/dispanin family protein [Rhodococcus sp. NPDC054953]
MYPTQNSVHPHTGSTAPAYSATPPLPDSNAGWAVAALLFFWPLSFAAFNHSSRVYPLWAMGDYASAKYASDRAKSLGKISLFLSVMVLTLTVVLYIGAIAFALSMSSASTY